MRKPKSPPSSAPAKIPSCVSPHQVATETKNSATGTVTVVARPSKPSVIFTAFTVPTMIKAASTKYTGQLRCQ